MRIIDLHPGYEQIIEQAAVILVEAFKERWPDAWPDLDSALSEVHESLCDDRISRVAVDDHGSVLGWVGAIKMYDGRVWELHPLAVRPRAQGRGVGRALVEDLEKQVAERGLVIGLDGFDVALRDIDIGHFFSPTGMREPTAT